ncbi:MAG TPA: hypothetical protein VEV16_07455 [Daejeonella sp.]|nr:hypothetical protein [Daejeonella sp.]
MNEIIDFITQESNKVEDLSLILHKHHIENIQDIKIDLLDLLVEYASFILRDNYISASELYDFSALKRIFRIKEGDFMQFKPLEAKEILKQQFIRLYSDHRIDEQEALEKVNLQSLFDLSYDEFEMLMQDEIILSLINGADPKDLDISTLPKGFKI